LNPLRAIGRPCGAEKSFIEFKLLCGWRLMNVFSLIIVGANRELELLPLALLVTEKMKPLFMDWIFKNTNNQNKKWITLFMVACWHLWMWRNKNIFEEDFQRSTDPIVKILKMVDDIDNYTRHPLNIRRCDTIFIGWKRPQEGWIKLNCDGALKNSLGLAGCGGLFRNSDGRWIKGYARKIGTCDTLCAEMWGMYLGIELAWRQGFHHLEVESDSKTLVDMITGKVKINGNPPTLMCRIQDLN
ncbi:ribonuclease H protein, partial [Trifolium medium]|nr:ribonuclease H protein [Trifolium medium]